jgi:hypothetical protein
LNEPELLIPPFLQPNSWKYFYFPVAAAAAHRREGAVVGLAFYLGLAALGGVACFIVCSLFVRARDGLLRWATRFVIALAVVESAGHVYQQSISWRGAVILVTLLAVAAGSRVWTALTRRQRPSTARGGGHSTGPSRAPGAS